MPDGSSLAASEASPARGARRRTCPTDAPSAARLGQTGTMSAQAPRRYLALRTGVAAAAGVTAATFSRGLLPRSTTDQAMATAATAAYGLGAGTVALSAIEATSELVSKHRGQGDPQTQTLVVALGLAAAGAIVNRALPNTPSTPLLVATAESASRIMAAGSLAATLVIGGDKLMRHIAGTRGPGFDIALAAGLGGAASATRVYRRDRRAVRVGEHGDRKQITLPDSALGLAQSVGIGAAVGGGLLALAAAEFAVAEGSARLVTLAIGRDEPVPPLVGHAIAATTLVPIGGFALNRLRRRIQHADDVLEPAYPDPPDNQRVTAGPRSLIRFDEIGKEGRRFVLMALTAREIGELMGEPAVDPVRAVAGFESAKDPMERAQLALDELEALGAYERSVIVVAAPTGVGYVNYSFAEALEYLTKGDCAIVVPQYALVPSALALNQTQAGVDMQTMILAGIRDRIAGMPAEKRPRLFQFGESLGAQVALDVAAEGTDRFDELGLSGGLYLGTPFRTRLWDRWFTDPMTIDPSGMVGLVSQASEIPQILPTARHIQVIHHDDPINKFAYDLVVKTPWWMGPPETRPPGVPRETQFRPVVTFVIALVDLKNGMNSKPGTFVRIGHDYRIELVDAIRHSFGFTASPEQCAAIEEALREDERQWAARRMVATRFAHARESVIGQLTKWGVDPSSVGLDEAVAGNLARGDITGLASHLGTSGAAEG